MRHYSIAHILRDIHMVHIKRSIMRNKYIYFLSHTDNINRLWSFVIFSDLLIYKLFYSNQTE